MDRVVCCGGIAEKNDLFMQVSADLLGRPMLIAGSFQTPALEAAISVAVAAAPEQEDTTPSKMGVPSKAATDGTRE